MAQPEIRRGDADTPPGQGEQLPKGAAENYNEAVPTEPQAPDTGAPAPPPAQGPAGPGPEAGGTEAGGPTDADLAAIEAQLLAEENPGEPEFAPDGYDPIYSDSGLTEDEEILLADHPNGPQRIRYASSKQAKIPTRVIRQLPAIQRLAQQPGAPPSIRALYKAIVDHLEREMNE